MIPFEKWHSNLNVQLNPGRLSLELILTVLDYKGEDLSIPFLCVYVSFTKRPKFVLIAILSRRSVIYKSYVSLFIQGVLKWLGASQVTVYNLFESTIKLESVRRSRWLFAHITYIYYNMIHNLSLFQTICTQ